MWTKLADTDVITFEDLPNHEELDLNQFNVVDIRDAMGKQDKKVNTSSIILRKLEKGIENRLS